MVVPTQAIAKTKVGSRPRPSLTGEARNCVSNIRPEGLPYPATAAKLFLLLQESLRRQLSGVGLKDEFDQLGE